MRSITVENGGDNERRRAVRGFWDGNKIMDGCSGCGIVIKGVDKERKSITISKIAAPLEVCALSAEVTGACMLTNILNVVFHKNVC